MGLRGNAAGLCFFSKSHLSLIAASLILREARETVRIDGVQLTLCEEAMLFFCCVSRYFCC